MDRKIEFPAPTEEARARIMQIHARKMNVDPDVNYEELARSTDDFNGAQVKQTRYYYHYQTYTDHQLGLMSNICSARQCAWRPV